MGKRGGKRAAASGVGEGVVGEVEATIELSRDQIDRLEFEDVATLDPPLLRAYGRALNQTSGTKQWRLGEVLLVIHNRHLAKSWGFKNFLGYVTIELGMPTGYAKRVAGVARYFGPFKDEVKDVPWWTLVEAVRLAKQLTPEEAIDFAKQGQLAVKGKLRELHEAGVAIPLEDQSWRRLILNLPPDVYETFKQDGLDIARRYLSHIGGTWSDENPWQLFQALVTEGIQNMREQLPQEVLDGPAPIAPTTAAPKATQ